MATQALAEERAVTSNRVLELMARALRIESRRPTARFLHLFNTHAPARVDADCRPVNSLPWVRQTAIAQSRCAVTSLTALLRSLQDQSIYDRTAIAVLADHGAGLPRGRQAWVWGSYASPLLMVKPFGARGALARSARVVGLSDLPASVCAWTGDCRVESGSDFARDARGRRSTRSSSTTGAMNTGSRNRFRSSSATSCAGHRATAPRGIAWSPPRAVRRDA
jgi:hypothetical protein